MLATDKSLLLTLTGVCAICCLAVACGEEDDSGPGPTTSSSGTGGNQGGGGSDGGGGSGGDTSEGGSLATYCGTVDLGSHAGDTPANTPETVVSGLAFPRLITLDGDQLYVADSSFDGSDGTIIAAPKAGGAAQQLAATNVNNASGLGVADGWVYWSNADNASLMRVPMGGGSEEPFFPSGPLDAMSVGAEHVFGTASGFVYAYPLDGSDPFTVMSDLTVGVSLFAHGGQIYAADVGVQDVAEFPAGIILRSPSDGSGQTALVSDQNRLLSVAAEQGGTVVWLDGGHSASNFVDGALHLLSPHCGAEPVTVVVGIDTGWTLTLSETEAIWAGFDGRVWGLDMTDGDLTLYGDDGGQALGVAADATHVYWTDAQSGEVRRAPR